MLNILLYMIVVVALVVLWRRYDPRATDLSGLIVIALLWPLTLPIYLVSRAVDKLKRALRHHG